MLIYFSKLEGERLRCFVKNTVKRKTKTNFILISWICCKLARLPPPRRNIQVVGQWRAAISCLPSIELCY